VRWNKAVKAEI